MSIVSDNISKLPFWQILTEREKEFLLDNSITKKHLHNSVIYENSDEPLGMALILSGYAKVNTISDTGREIVLFKLKAGNVCMLQELENCSFAFHTQLIAVSDVVLLIINYKAIKKLINNNIYVKSFVYELASSKLSKTVYALQNVIFLRTERRLANYLLSEYNRSGSKTIRMTQEEIANEINSAREVVARTIKEFVKNGCVDLIKRGELYLKNSEKLKTVGI